MSNFEAAQPSLAHRLASAAVPRNAEQWGAYATASITGCATATAVGGGVAASIVLCATPVVLATGVVIWKNDQDACEQLGIKVGQTLRKLAFWKGATNV